MYKYLFGPVPSRRLGMSLGVDLVPKKVCSLNCVYCEVGETTKLTTKRMEYIPYKKIVSELNRYFESGPSPDYITFSGYGEPTLNSALGNIIKFIKEKKPDIPVAVLTNGTLFSSPRVRMELLPADLILPSLDAATQEAFEKINMPAPGINIDTYIEGLAEFRKEFKGIIWLEVFILPGYNDSESELTELKKAIVKINPDRIQLNTLDRPGTVEDLKGASAEDLQKIIDFWALSNVEIIAKVQERKNMTSYRTDIESAILGTIARRPCTSDDLAQILGTHVNEINKYLETLESEQKIKHVRQERGIFYYIH
ncbi:MAG: radical SAM protein [Prolixibacteraceae bacterium]|nr:radical SAM protein [Prolixibacteraceae bacterium]